MFRAQTVRREIEARNREFMSAFNRGDADGVAATYTEDARILPPGALAMTDRQAIQRFW